MELKDKIAKFEKNLDEYIKQVENIVHSDQLGLCGFILICCLIDFVVQYTSSTETKDPNIDSKNKSEIKFKNFISKYLKVVDVRYDEKLLFDSII
jgi:hypothetical protein